MIMKINLLAISVFLTAVNAMEIPIEVRKVQENTMKVLRTRGYDGDAISAVSLEFDYSKRYQEATNMTFNNNFEFWNTKIIFEDAKKEDQEVSDSPNMNPSIRHLSSSFTCQAGWSTPSPWSICSDVVDYPYMLSDSTTVGALEDAARAAVPSLADFISNTCLSDYKRMFCAQIYLPCVDNGTWAPLFQQPGSVSLSLSLSDRPAAGTS